MKTDFKSEDVFFKTRDLKWWQKIAQMAFFPKSWLLDEFSIKDSQITIRTKKGKEISAPLSELQVKRHRAGNGQDDIMVKFKDQKLRFKVGIAYMLKDEEWEEIIAILKPKEGVFSKIINVINTVKNAVE
jgi:hypothetical protein